jgi:hypothetical protein
LVERPAVCVFHSARLTEAAKLAIEHELLLAGHLTGLRPTVDHEAEFTIDEIDIASAPLRDPAAGPAWRLALQDGGALWAAR